MRIRSIAFVLGLLVGCLAICLLLPLSISLLYKEYETAKLFTYSLLTILTIGLVTSYINKPPKGEKIHLTARDGVAIVGLCWILATVICAIPYVLVAHVNFAFGIFEAASGLSTTGASIFSNVEILPKGLLFWRSFTQWLGGLGIIVLSLAILPFLGAGGMQLYKAEVSGISKDKVAPRMIDTARSLWGVYIALTGILWILLYFQGMSSFDAINHALPTLATGGFSTKNASLAAFSPLNQWTIIVFMYLGSINFTLHFLFLHSGVKKYFENEEFIYYTIFLLAGICIIAGHLYFDDTKAQSLMGEPAVPYTIERAFRDSAFQLISITTTTGFVTADYLNWPVFTQVLILVYMMCGGCGGSTAGGIKFMRILIIFKLIRNELNRLTHPQAVERIKINHVSIEPTAIRGVTTFFAIFFISIFIGTLILTATGLDIITSFSAVITCFSNSGPGLGLVGPAYNFSFLSEFNLTILSAYMIFGRLEIFTFLLLFMPKFWRL